MRIKRTRPLSLSLRVMLFVMLAIGLSLLLISRLVLSTVERHFVEQDVDELRVMIAAIEHTIAQNNKDLTDLHLSLSSAISGHHGVFYEVEDESGGVLFSSEGASFPSVVSGVGQLTEVDVSNLKLWTIDDRTYRGVVISTSIAGRQYQISSALDMEFHRNFLDAFEKSLWLILLGAGGITLLATWLGVYQGLRPLRGVSQSVRTIQTNKLDTRLDLATVPVELQDLVISFNQMIEQLEAGFIKLSHFSDDIAHEIRTPLTNMITQTQVGLSRKRGESDYRELLYSVLEEQERLNKMVNDMLWLAKSEHGLIKLNNTLVDLQDEFESLFDFFDAFADERHVSLTINSNKIKVQCDKDLLKRALTNLLSNAIYHSAKDGVVKVNLSENQHLVEITIENTGPAIEPVHLTRIFDRFYRVDPSRQRNLEGVGLGLAIVKSVIQAHGGQIAVLSNANITRFTVQLPRASLG